MPKRKSKNDSDEDYDPDEIESDFPELNDCEPKIRKELSRIQSEVEKSEPNIIEILNTSLLTKDKVELFQLFEVYANVPDGISLERLDLKRQLQNKLEAAIAKKKQYDKFTRKQHEEFDSQIKLLEQYDEKEELKYDILNLETSHENRQIIYNEYRRMTNMPFTDDELPKIRRWLKWSLSIPHDRLKQTSFTSSQLTQFLHKVRARMDEELYGMKNVKEQILLFLNSRLLNPKMQKCSLGLLGAPGCGKTSIVRLLADILEYPLQQISLGGVRSPEYLKGHQYTYIGAEPGEIVKCLRRMGVKNGILFFDEYDKVSENKDVCASLLHITDSSQNSKFQDNFLSGITVDLSHLWFCYSMNKKPEDDALSDRIYYVEIDPYTKEDKKLIVRDYLLKKAHKNMGWKENSVYFQEDAIDYLIEKVSPTESGIRCLDHAVTAIANKINFLYHHQDKQGKLTDFQASFEIGKRLTFPFCITRKILDIYHVNENDREGKRNI